MLAFGSSNSSLAAKTKLKGVFPSLRPKGDEGFPEIVLLHHYEICMEPALNQYMNRLILLHRLLLSDITQSSFHQFALGGGLLSKKAIRD
ncbi:MAG: hypothetical protein ACLPY5_00035 [Candidatus Bathyarchaeia archaeon]